MSSKTMLILYYSGSVHFVHRRLRLTVRYAHRRLLFALYSSKHQLVEALTSTLCALYSSKLLLDDALTSTMHKHRQTNRLTGNTEKMAKTIADVVSENSIDVKVEEVENFELSNLPKYDAIAIGSPTYFSNVAWQVKKVIDESIRFYSGKRLSGKVAGIFTSSGTRRDAQDCLRILEIAFGFHHGMNIIEGIIRVDGQ